MILSQTAEYALRAMSRLALLGEGQAMRAEDLAEATSIPVHYLSKVMRRLVLAGLVTSQKGHGGGFALARPASQVRFADVLFATGITVESDRCGFGWGTCNPSAPCPLHNAWTDLNQRCENWARENTLADVIQRGGMIAVASLHRR